MIHSHSATLHSYQHIQVFPISVTMCFPISMSMTWHRSAGSNNLHYIFYSTISHLFHDGKHQFISCFVSAQSSDCSSRKTSVPLSLYMKLITTNSEDGEERGREGGGDTEGKRLIDWKEGGESVRRGREEERNKWMNVWIQENDRKKRRRRKWKP